MRRSLLENVLITGADGMVGSYADFGIRTTRAELDVTDRALVRRRCLEWRPAVILHLAAATDLTQCQREPDSAYRVNAIGTYNLALAAREIGAKLVYVSTSGVFDGMKQSPYVPEDRPNPINEYGHSKYLGELISASMVEDHLIARIAWVFGGGKGKDSKFIAKIIAQLDKPVIAAVSDTRGSPSYGKDAVARLKLLIETGARGIHHISNAGQASRADIAREIVRITGSGSVVEEVSASAFAAAYPSGANEGMETAEGMRSWQDALREYIEVEWPEAIRS